ncbi:hypothetical protein ACIQ9P_25445 [Kitasatospora sp. NPDC094019]|uniref:hypothetical protein n=1 Tax=Kitasatospora sp. NPDC094019 TaxID=3364091 RepID=UPI0038290253
MKDNRMFDPDGGDPLHLPDQHDAVEGFAEFVAEVAEFVADLAEDVAGAIGLLDGPDEDGALGGDEPSAAGGAALDGPAPGSVDAARVGPVDPDADVDPTDLIRDILNADPEQLASMEEQLNGIVDPDRTGSPGLPPDLPPDLRGSV